MESRVSRDEEGEDFGELEGTKSRVSNSGESLRSFLVPTRITEAFSQK